MSTHSKKPTLLSLIVLAALFVVALPSLTSSASTIIQTLPAPVAPEPYPFSDRYPAVVYLDSQADLQTLYRLDIDFEGLQAVAGGQEKSGENFQPALATVYINSEEAAQLAQLGLNPIPIPNEGLRSFHEYGPGSGSLNAWPSFDAFVQRMQGIETTYPALADLISIGQSVEGRDIWCLKISDNVSMEEDEPEFKYSSTIHGDETTGIELTLRLAELLLGSYDIDPELTALVNGVEIWLCPIHNPDGYFHGTRYNMHYEDLNREFPDRFTDPIDDPAGHEPENQAFMYLGYGQRFVMGANYHGGELVLNYPWDAISPPKVLNLGIYAPDDALFHDLGLGYTSRNPMIYNGGFYQGLTRGWEWYQIWGGMQDYAYYYRGEHHVTIEVSDTKWPPYDQMDTYWNNNREAMIWWLKSSLTGIRGRVLDARNGLPLNATVTVNGMEMPNFARTDPLVGDYHRVISAGYYTLTASASGYQSLSHQVTVVDGAATVQDFLLNELPPDLSGSSKNVSSLEALPGDILQYQVILLNAGVPTTATLTDTLPLSITWTGELSASQGVPVYDNGQILWQGLLEQGNLVTVTYTTSVNPCLVEGNIINNVAAIQDHLGMVIERSALVNISNQTPAIPNLLSPIDGASDQPQDISLSWSASSDLNCDTLTYDVYLGTINPPPLVASGLSETTYTLAELLPHTTYYWSVSASDGLSQSRSTTWQFTTLNHVPELPSIVYPPDKSKDLPTSLVFSWSASDPDNDALTYSLTYWVDGNQPITITGITEMQYDPGLLQAGVTYYWQLTVSDGFETTVGEVWRFSTQQFSRIYLPLALKTSNQEP